MKILLLFHFRILTHIMSEMIKTEKDYVNALKLVIVNYLPELNRDDVVQPLRGKRNIVFGNLEKIYEFHSQTFLQELEHCHEAPLNVGATFLRNVSSYYYIKYLASALFEYTLVC